jgi:hypothetical protein
MASLAANSVPTIRTSEARDDWKPLRKTPSQPAEKYRIGEIGSPWGDREKQQWLDQTTVQRSYQVEVVEKLQTTVDPALFDVRQYGTIHPNGGGEFPLLAAISKDWSLTKPSVLVTGGVHGYETSGVQGAILFVTSGAAAKYAPAFNIVVCPCVSPWGYERVERWNSQCLDPNRSFGSDPATHTQESAAVKGLLASLNAAGHVGWICHCDLHETTDTDESEYMPARAALGGSVYKRCDIPDGFYLVGDSVKPEEAWHKAIIDSVRQVTHICPGDATGAIIEEPLTQDGCIQVPSAKLGLCASVTGATYATTTEVYPDSKVATVTGEQCNRAQVAAVTGALDFIKEKHVM